MAYYIMLFEKVVWIDYLQDVLWPLSSQQCFVQNVIQTLSFIRRVCLIQKMYYVLFHLAMTSADWATNLG